MSVRDAAGSADAGAREASTVMLLRDGAVGTEVLLARRHHRARFVPGAYVFPGGLVDPADGREEMKDVVEGLDDEAASLAIGTQSGGIRFWVAAVRECFEEVAVLLARQEYETSLVRLDGTDVGDRLSKVRGELHRGRTDLRSICVGERLSVSLDVLVPVSRWISPESARHRYDTVFFVAVMPPGQHPRPHLAEISEMRWFRPPDAISQHVAGRMQLTLPTRANLASIPCGRSAAEVVTALRRKLPVAATTPRLSPAGDDVR